LLCGGAKLVILGASPASLKNEGCKEKRSDLLALKFCTPRAGISATLLGRAINRSEPLITPSFSVARWF